jgi:hypothetical protein
MKTRAIPGTRPALLLAAALAIATSPSSARAFEWSRVQAHTTFGYGRLTKSHPTGGSIGLTVGFEHPIRPGLDAGIDLGLYLYGNRTVERGSLNATVDYGTQDIVLFTHWQTKLGPLTRISIGPGLTHARAELSVSAGGAAFLDLAVDELAPTAAVDLTMIRRRPAPVRVGFVAGYRGIFLDEEDWHQFSVRVALHY